MKRLAEKRAAKRTEEQLRTWRKRRLDVGRARGGRVHVAGAPKWSFNPTPTIEHEGIVVQLGEWTTALLVHGGKRLRAHVLVYSNHRDDGYAISIRGATGILVRDTAIAGTCEDLSLGRSALKPELPEAGAFVGVQP